MFLFVSLFCGWSFSFFFFFQAEDGIRDLTVTGVQTCALPICIEQQLTGQSVLIPQGGDVLFLNGQLDTARNSTGHCSCEAQVARAIPPQLEIGQLATAEEMRKNAPAVKPNLPPAPVEKPAVKEEPVYQFFMPPLMYDAN